MDLELATAQPSQHAAIDRLMLAAFAPYVEKLGRGSTAGPYPWLEAAICRGDVYVALDGAEIVGVVATSRRNDELIIDQLAVDPALQGAGVGGWLLKQVERIARLDQIKALSLQTAEMMSHLLRLYQQHGFVETRKALPAHGDDEHLRVHMTKFL